MDAPKIIDVLDGIIQQDRCPTAPCHGKVHRNQKGETRCPSLTTRINELGIDIVANTET